MALTPTLVDAISRRLVDVRSLLTRTRACQDWILSRCWWLIPTSENHATAVEAPCSSQGWRSEWSPGPLKTAVGVLAEIYIDPFDPAHLASAKAAVHDDGRARGGASPVLPHPGWRGRIWSVHVCRVFVASPTSDPGPCGTAA
jgi:hypothetical protein